MERMILYTDEDIRCDVPGCRSRATWGWPDCDCRSYRCDCHTKNVSPAGVNKFDIVIDIATPPCRKMEPDATCMIGSNKGSVCPYWKGEHRMAVIDGEMCEHFAKAKGCQMVE
jgi:hypothetical protein